MNALQQNGEALAYVQQLTARRVQCLHQGSSTQSPPTLLLSPIVASLWPIPSLKERRTFTMERKHLRLSGTVACGADSGRKPARLRLAAQVVSEQYSSAASTGTGVVVCQDVEAVNVIQEWTFCESRGDDGTTQLQKNVHFRIAMLDILNLVEGQLPEDGEGGSKLAVCTEWMVLGHDSDDRRVDDSATISLQVCLNIKTLTGESLNHCLLAPVQLYNCTTVDANRRRY